MSEQNERVVGVPANRSDLGRFLPGASGNPSGRSKEERQLKALTREYTLEAVEGIVAIARTAKQDRTRLMAWDIILDRGWGKPAQMIETDGEQLVVVVKTIGGADPFVMPETRTKALPEPVS